MAKTTLPIITVPHPTLREVAQQVTEVTPELVHFVGKLEETLRQTRNPKGVGLAAPQVDTRWRIFTTAVDGEVLTLVNPRMIDASEALTLGPNADDPILEGCLSMPHLYGPVPRHTWVDMGFDVLTKQGTQEWKLVGAKRRFVDFFARVVQHEQDHLDGILFIDHSLTYDLPVYLENEKNKKSEEVDRSFLELF